MKNMKKLIALLLAAVCMLTFAACGGKTEATTVPTDPQETLDEVKDDVFDQMESIANDNAGADVGSYAEGSDADFTWEATEGGVMITEYIGTNTSVAVPAQLGGQDVVAIGDAAFAGKEVVGVSLPDTVVTIGEEAFYYCLALVEVRFGAGVRTVGLDAFHGCVALSDVYLNEGLQEIGERAFCMCGMVKSIQLPGTLETIGVGAFTMAGLPSVTVPGSVKLVDMQAFAYCSELTTVAIEDGAVTLGDEVFQNCKALKDVTLPGSVTEFGWDVFSYCENFVIHAPAGSAAESYAAEFNHTFKSN